MSIKKQALINTIGNMVYLVALWFLTVTTTRVMSYEETGVLTLAMAIGNIIAIIQLYGVRSYQSSDMLFQYSAREYVYSRVITVVIGLLIGLLICILVKYSVEVSSAILLFSFLKNSSM